jgi:Ni,Fe-hydrogenase III large subunit
MIVQGKAAFGELVELIMTSSSVIDRLETTGIVSPLDAYRLGITGIAGRASGIDRDYRRDHPHCAYPSLKVHVATRTEGDVLARLHVRIDEVRDAFAILESLRDRSIGQPTIARDTAISPDQYALGYAEGWRGEIIHWLMTDKAGNVYRWKITDPSFHNWRALTIAVRNNIVPDFPVINKSFDLSYSGNDR